MVNQRLYFNDRALIAQCGELSYDLIFNFVVINNTFLVYVSWLSLKTKINNFDNIIDQALIASRFHFEFYWEVTSVDALLETLYMATDVSFGVNQLSLTEFLWVFFLLIWEDNVTSESLSHKQIFAKCARTSSKNFVRVCGNNCTQGKNEIMDLLHVKEVGCYGI